MIKEKLNNKINNGKKLDYQPNESVFYPFEDSCNSIQQVWLSDTEIIEIHYKNIEKWWKERECAQEWSKNSVIEDVYVFQELDDPNLTEIEIAVSLPRPRTPIPKRNFCIETSRRDSIDLKSLLTDLAPHPFFFSYIKIIRFKIKLYTIYKILT